MGIIKVCQHCGSEDVRCDAWAVWNTELQYWELDETFQQEYCQSCEGETRIVDQALPAA